MYITVWIDDDEMRGDAGKVCVFGSTAEAMRAVGELIDHDKLDHVLDCGGKIKLMAEDDAVFLHIGAPVD